MSWIIKDIKEGLNKYPKLKLLKNKSIVEGLVEISNPQTGKVLEDYELSISFPKKYPYCKLPLVTEISNKIPRNEDRHIYKKPNGLFCLTTPIEELLICKKGITFTKFLDEVVIPFLATQMAISLGWLDKFPQGEYSHGDNGIYESYCDFFEINNKEKIITGIKMALNKNQRNTYCFCGSKEKLKNCHLQKVINLKALGKDKLSKDLQLIKNLIR